MCFICRVLSGREFLTALQACNFKPVAAAVYNASCEAVRLSPLAIDALRALAKQRRAPDVLEVVRLLNAYDGVRNAATDYYRKHGSDGHLSRVEAAQAMDTRPGPVNKLAFEPSLGLSPAEQEALNRLQLEVEDLAGRISRLDPLALPMLRSCQRSQRAARIIEVLTDARERIQTALH